LIAGITHVATSILQRLRRGTLLLGNLLTTLVGLLGEIVLTGGTAHLHGLAEELQTLIGVSVRPGDPLTRVKVGKKIKDAEQVGSLATAIGLGIED